MTPIEHGVQQDDRSSVAAVVRGNSEFALDLYQELRESEGNLFLSPFSISTALAMTYAGSRANTAVQMAQVLHFDLAQERLHAAFAMLDRELAAAQATGDIALHVANSLWPLVGYTFLPAYLELCQRYYGVSITALDYCTDPDGARRTINAWVEHKTHEKIQDLLAPPHVTPLTTLILVNAIYFKGNWVSQFDPEATHDATFYLSG